MTYKFIQSTSDLWKSYVQHDFVVQLGKGTLDRSNFIHFIKYARFLRVYADIYPRSGRTICISSITRERTRTCLRHLNESPRLKRLRLLATKSHEFGPIASAVKVMCDIAAETTMHVAYCEQFGVTLEELERTPESPATIAYGAFLIDVGLQGASVPRRPTLTHPP